MLELPEILRRFVGTSVGVGGGGRYVAEGVERGEGREAESERRAVEGGGEARAVRGECEREGRGEEEAEGGRGGRDSE